MNTIKWSVVAGIAFIVLAWLGLDGIGNLPDEQDSKSVVGAFWGDADERANVLIGGIMFMAATVLFAIFAVNLQHVLTAGTQPSRVASLAQLALTGYVVLLLAGVAARITLAGAFTLDEQPVPPAEEVMRFFPWLGWALIRFCGLVLAAVWLVSTGLLALRHPAWPRWLGILTIVVGVILPLGGPFTPLSLLPLWIIIVSVFLFLRADKLEAASPSVPG